MNPFRENSALVPVRTSATAIRGRMPQIPEEQVLPGGSRWPRFNSSPWMWIAARSSHSRRTRGVAQTLRNINNGLLNNARNAPRTRNDPRHCNRDEFNDYECCRQCYYLELVMLCKLNKLPILEDADSEPVQEPVPPNNNVLPLEMYVKETDELIKKLLAEIAERKMDIE